MTSQRTGGPTTEAGKKKTSLNALKTGAYAKTIVLPYERVEDYALLEASLFRDFGSQDQLSDHLVRELSAVIWKIMRVTNIEHMEIQELFNRKVTQLELREESEVRGIDLHKREYWILNYLGDLTLEDVEWRQNLVNQLDLYMIDDDEEMSEEDFQAFLKESPDIVKDIKEEFEKDGLIEVSDDYEVLRLAKTKIRNVRDEPAISTRSKKSIMAGITNAYLHQDSWREVNRLGHYLLEWYNDMTTEIILLPQKEAIEAMIKNIRQRRVLALLENSKISRALTTLSYQRRFLINELRQHLNWKNARRVVDLPREEVVHIAA